MTSTTLPSLGDIIGGRYQIKSVIASGGMGVVMRGQHVKMGRDVAVKFLHAHLIQDADIRQRFEREVDIAKDLIHPNVIHVYDYGETPGGNLYLVMEYLEGNDLKHVLKTEKRFNVGRALNIMTQILDGLAEAHVRNVVHRDLKPANIFVTTDRHGNDLVKILDFGIAKSLQADQDITKTGTLCGTVAYMAPEAILAGGDTPSCDVYAAGLILLEMLTGKRAFRGESVAQTMMMQLQHNPTIPARLEQSPLGSVLLQATDKNAERRYKDADAMLAALRNIAHLVDSDLRLTDEEVPQSDDEATHSASDLYRPQPLPNIPIPSAANPTKNNQENTQHLSINDLDDLEWEDLSDSTRSSSQHQAIAPQDLRPTEVLEQPTFAPQDLRPTEVLEQPTLTPGNFSPALQPAANASSTSTALTYSQPEAAARSRKPLLIGLAALLSVALLAAGFVLFGKNAATPTPAPQHKDAPAAQAPEPKPEPAAGAALAAQAPEPEPASEPELPQSFTFTLQTTPPGATLYVNNTELGTSPLTVTLEQNKLPATLLILLDGYEDLTQLIEEDSTALLNFKLNEIVADAAEDALPMPEASAQETPSEVPVAAETKTKAPPKPAEQAASSKSTTRSTSTKTTTTKSKAAEPATPNVDDLLNRYFD